MAASLLGGCGVCRACAELIEGEQAADVDNPRTIDRDTFSLEYPGNWKIETDADDYDPDHAFTIESEGECMVMFEMQDGFMDPGVMSDKKVEDVSVIIFDSTKTQMDTWGDLVGKGYLIEGTVLALPGSVRVFSHATDDLSFTVIEQCWDEDIHLVEPGFDLVRSTFELK